MPRSKKHMIWIADTLKMKREAEKQKVIAKKQKV